MTTHDQTVNAREAAFSALLSFFRDGKFLSESLAEWQRHSRPSPLDYHLAQEISYGSTRMALALDFLGSELSREKKLSLKLKEKVLLRTALYQYFYLQKIPLYALTNETLRIAKKHCHSHFSGFLNAVLRKLGTFVPSLPSGDNAEQLSIRYSYPLYFVQKILEEHGHSVAQQILSAGNRSPSVEFRVRTLAGGLPHGSRMIAEHPIPFAALDDSQVLPVITSSKHYYVQNRTPAFLLNGLCKEMAFQPKTILDLCSAPGGKLIAVHDQFPEAALLAHDLTQAKIDLLQTNLDKYGIKAALSCGKGEDFCVKDPVDVVILDVPCSNTGVLNKRPEARWRLSQESVCSLRHIQESLFANALTCVRSGGEIWYMTCSTLNEENQGFAKEMSSKYGVPFRWQESILADDSGMDGGFACAFRKD
jgi:16S rRNA (cytosine967-C5)-methyltransferase